MLEEIKAFFEGFAGEISTFDGSVIGKRYMAPYSAVSIDGDIWLCNSDEEIFEYFQSLLDRHRENGVLTCKASEIKCEPIGRRCFLASVTWAMLGENDSVVVTWRESYNLIDTGAGLKIFTSIDH